MARRPDEESASPSTLKDTATRPPTFGSTGLTTTLESASAAETLAGTTAVGAATATTDRTAPLEPSYHANQSASSVRRNGGSSYQS